MKHLETTLYFDGARPMTQTQLENISQTSAAMNMEMRSWI